MKSTWLLGALALVGALIGAPALAQTQPAPTAPLNGGRSADTIPTSLVIAPAGGGYGVGKIVADDQGLPVVCLSGCSGGSGGGGGAITAAASSIAAGAGVDGWDLSQGAKVDNACSTDNGTCSLLALVKRGNQRVTSLITALGSPFQAGGSIGNTSFGISGTLPAFASTPTFNLGTLNGAALDASVTATQANAGSDASKAIAIQGITSGKAIPTNAQASTTGGATVKSLQVANNTTSVAVCTAACTLYGVFVQNNSATIAYLKLYNAAQGSTTCGSGTPVDRIIIPANTNGGGAMVPIAGGVGAAYGTALTSCVTTGFGDSDTTAPAANAYQISFYYK